MRLNKDIITHWNNLGHFAANLFKFYLSPFFVAWAAAWVLYLEIEDQYLPVIFHGIVSIILYKWTKATLPK